MSQFDLCNKTDRGTLSELTSKGELDELILGNDVNPFAQKQSPHVNHATDHGVRSPFEGTRNVYPATVPEEGDLLYAASIVIRPRRGPDGKMEYRLKPSTPTATPVDITCSADLIESVELRINNQCIQRIERDALDVPFTHTNFPGSAKQCVALNQIQCLTGGSFYIPLNFFFSKTGNAYPLINSLYPVQVRVNLVADNKGILRKDGSDTTKHVGWENFDMYLETSQVYVEDSAREELARKQRDMVVVQRSSATYQAPTNQTTFSVKLENNLPIRSMDISGDRVRDDTLARFFVNGELRFEHEIGWMDSFGILQGHGGGEGYRFGMPCQKGVSGRMNLSLMDAPRLDLHYIDKEAGSGEDNEIEVYIENYNVLRWKDGKARLLLHKNRL